MEAKTKRLTRRFGIDNSSISLDDNEKGEAMSRLADLEDEIEVLENLIEEGLIYSDFDKLKYVAYRLLAKVK